MALISKCKVATHIYHLICVWIKCVGNYLQIIRASKAICIKISVTFFIVAVLCNQRRWLNIFELLNTIECDPKKYLMCAPDLVTWEHLSPVRFGSSKYIWNMLDSFALRKTSLYPRWSEVCTAVYILCVQYGISQLCPYSQYLGCTNICLATQIFWKLPQAYCIVAKL